LKGLGRILAMVLIHGSDLEMVMMVVVFARKWLYICLMADGMFVFIFGNDCTNYVLDEE
jgi:hypothetical protein